MPLAADGSACLGPRLQATRRPRMATTGNSGKARMIVKPLDPAC